MAEQPSDGRKHRRVPPVMEVCVEGIPERLRELHCWIPWEPRIREGEYCKVPIGEDRPGPFKAALGHGAGVGVRLGKYGDFHLCAVDFDDCVVDGVEEEWTLRRARELCTYCELSPSGLGLRLLFLSKGPFEDLRGCIRGRTVEASCTRWFTVTGRRRGWAPHGLKDLTEQHPTLLADLFRADTDRRARQLVEWTEPTTLAEPDGVVEVWDALTHLKGWRCTEWPGWIRVLYCLRNSDEDEQFREMAHEWSKGGGEKYNQAAIETIEGLWAKPPRAESGYNLRRLRWWAREDYPDEYKPPEGGHERLTDVGNGNIVARLARGRATYVPEARVWYDWDERRWAKGDGSRVDEIAKEAARLRFEQLGRSIWKVANARGEKEMEKRRKELGHVFAWAFKSEDAHHVLAAVRMARSRPAARTPIGAFDQHPYLLNFLNCTMDLRTGEMREHRREDMLTQVCPVEWRPNAECPMWLEYLRTTIPNEEVRGFLGLFLGSCLCGAAGKQVMPILWGVGENGKTTLVETMLAVMGEDYAMKADRRLLMTDRSSEGDRSRARLLGKRFVACVETEQGGKLNETEVKELTGGDSVTARFLYKEQFQFKPTHKLVLATNYRPDVKDISDAMWARLPLIEFGQQFLRGDPRRIEKLEERLAAEEGAGIMRWLVERCREWIAGGEKLVMPRAVKEWSLAYRESQDDVGLFVRERCALGPGEKERAQKLLGQYKVWCDENRVRPLATRQFTEAVRRFGVTRGRGDQYYHGARLMTLEELNPPGGSSEK
jgi:putative DNA primase/helicase